MKDYSQILTDEMTKYGESITFPADKISDTVANFIDRSLLYESIISLNVTTDDYDQIITKPIHEINIILFERVVNTLKRRTPKQLEVTRREYLYLQLQVKIMLEEYSAIINPVFEAKKIEVEKMAQRDQREAEAKGKIMRVK